MPTKMQIGGVTATKLPNGQWVEQCPTCGKKIVGSAFALQQHNRWCL